MGYLLLIVDEVVLLYVLLLLLVSDGVLIGGVIFGCWGFVFVFWVVGWFIF